MTDPDRQHQSGADAFAGFTLSACGNYYCRYGAAVPPDAPESARKRAPLNKKLCLVATDRDLLLSLLRDLSARDDCFFVKLSHVPKDGMFLGRVFLTDEAALGALWSELKAHPRLMCSLQDDDATLRYRNPAKTAGKSDP